MRTGLPLLLLLLGCRDLPRPPQSKVTYTEEREPCADNDPYRVALYGDLHVHGRFSFDAANYGSKLGPADLLAFAAGKMVKLPPDNSRMARLARPLDFVSATEHGEFLGEIAICTDPDAEGYDAPLCDPYKGKGDSGAFDFGLMVAAENPQRDPEVCGKDRKGCMAPARMRWEAMQEATEDAYDRTSTCALTAFPGYEYTNARRVANMHRNIVFRNANVPALPITTFEAPRPMDLWRQLDAQCRQAGTGCDVVSIPHNSNLSNGHLFDPAWATSDDDWVLRADMEPIVEIFQHKGDSECRNGFGDPHDPLCEFEKQRPPDDIICNGDDDPQRTGGMRLWGCSHRLDFVRNVLKEGLTVKKAIGMNPYRLGFIASTDTHNGTPGLTDSVDFLGHVGTIDDTAEKRLGDGNITHDGFINNPGGLAAVWAVENSRDAIFEAFQRGETFATSGPRIPVRFFGSWDKKGIPDDVCGRDDFLEQGYGRGVSMGGTLPEKPGRARAPRFVVRATADPGTPEHPGVGLERIQIVKGWLDKSGVAHEKVVTVVGGGQGTLDPNTCEASGGKPALCGVWDDEGWDESQSAFWYARVLEVPTCRWSKRECDAFPDSQRPPRCDGPNHREVVQQRSWSSPVWSK